VLLGIGAEFPLQAESAGQIVLDLVRHLHYEGEASADGSSSITDILENLTNHEDGNIRREANTCYGQLASQQFLERLSEKIRRASGRLNSEELEEFLGGIDTSASELQEYYYGSMCPGALESICESEVEQIEEYRKMRQCLGPIIQVFAKSSGIDIFNAILEDLERGLEYLASDDTYTKGFIDIYTLPLPFED
jgi:hypothetical protein